MKDIENNGKNKIVKNSQKSSGDSIISNEEQLDILKEIDRISGQSRINVTPDLFRIKALKKGILFPFMVNVFAVTILGGGIFATKYYFELEDQKMFMASTEQQSAEGNLIKEIKKETEKRLAEKENEILGIQASMDQIESERLSLEQNMTSKISEKELQLQREMEQALEDERAKLQAQGISTEDIDKKIAEMQLLQNSIFQDELNLFREEAQLEKIQLEDSLDQLASEYNNKLVNVNDERERIEAESLTRENELTERLERKTSELESEKSQAQLEIQKLTEQHEQESLIENQIVGFYKSIEDKIKEGALESASLELKNLENYLYDDSVVNLSGISKRRNIDLFVIDSLSKLIESSKPPEEVDTLSLIEAADRLKDIQETVNNADQQLAVGNNEMADMLYRNALEKVPEINRSHRHFIDVMESELELGYEQLSNIQSRFDQLVQDNNKRKVGVNSLLKEADETLESGKLTEAIEAYKKAFEATGFENLDEAADKMLDSGNQLAIAPFKERIENLNKQVNINPGNSEELSVLEDKIALKDREIRTYEELIAEKNQLLTSKEEDIALKSEQLDTFNSEMKTAKEKLDSTLAQLAQKDDALKIYAESDGSENVELSLLNERLESTLAELEKKEEEINAFSERDVSENDGAELSLLSEQLDQEKLEVLNLKSQIEKQSGDINSYEQRIEEMKSDLEEEKKNITISNEENQLIDAELAQLTTLKTQLKRLNKSYTDFEVMASSLEENIQGDAETIESLYTFFEEDSVETLFPGMGEYLRTFSNVYISAGTEIGLYEAVSLLYDLNNFSDNREKRAFLSVKRKEYGDNAPMVEMIDQIENAYR